MTSPDDATAIADLHARWAAAVARGDPDALGELVTDDYEVWASGIPAMRGRAVVVDGMRAALERVVAKPRALLILRRGDDGRRRCARGMTNALPTSPA
jgi:ketosteroid isomerase-like protein